MSSGAPGGDRGGPSKTAGIGGLVKRFKTVFRRKKGSTNEPTNEPTQAGESSGAAAPATIAAPAPREEAPAR